MNPLDAIKPYLYGALSVLFILMALGLWFQHNKLNDMEAQNDQLQVKVSNEATELRACSMSIKSELDKEKEIGDKLQVALDQAKKNSIKNFKASNDVMVYPAKGNTDCEKANDVMNNYLKGRGAK